jgi:DNA-binding XRE family transcriptional regulator
VFPLLAPFLQRTSGETSSLGFGVKRASGFMNEPLCFAIGSFPPPLRLRVLIMNTLSVYNQRMISLYAFRRRHDLTQREAAATVGIGLSTWRQIERGFRGRKPPAWLLNHLAALDALARKGIDWPQPTRIEHAADDQG